MKLDVSKEAREFLTALDAKQYKQVARKVFGLSVDPLPPDSSLLKGYEGLRRADIGEFRIVYEILEDTVEILAIGRRNDDAVYRALERKMR